MREIADTIDVDGTVYGEWSADDMCEKSNEAERQDDLWWKQSVIVSRHMLWHFDSHVCVYQTAYIPIALDYQIRVMLKSRYKSDLNLSRIFG